MKRIGIVGGLSPESTILYYNHMVKKYYEIRGNYNFPEIIIYSISFGIFSEKMRKGGAIEEILKALNSLHKAGADFAIISANTPHIFFDEIKEKSPLRLISIIDATVEEAKRRKWHNLLLLGTIFTMKSEYFRREYERNGINIFVPNDEEMKRISRVIFEELSRGIVRKESKKELMDIIKNYEDRIDGVILGCTELPLILSEKDGINVLDTARIHAEKALMNAII